MENTIIYDRIDELQANIDSQIGAMNSILLETSSIVYDIYYGSQSTEWIADLRTGGKSSETYKNSERMLFLYTNKIAVQDVSVSQYIFDYGIENSLNVGGFYDAATSDSSVDWSKYSMIDALAKDASAFKVISNNKNAINVTLDNQQSFNAVANNYSVTENILKNSTYATQNLNKNYQHRDYSMSNVSVPKTIINNICWVESFYTQGSKTDQWHKYNLSLMNNSVKEVYLNDESANRVYVNGFVRHAELIDWYWDKGNSSSNTPSLYLTVYGKHVNLLY